MIIFSEGGFLTVLSDFLMKKQNLIELEYQDLQTIKNGISIVNSDKCG